MGLFDAFKKKSWEEENKYTGDTPPCPNCGTLLSKKYVYSAMYCENCRYGFDDTEDNYDDSEAIHVYDAALIWKSNGKDEDYTFGFSTDELEEALKM